jgi:hypothetical protein
MGRARGGAARVCEGPSASHERRRRFRECASVMDHPKRTSYSFSRHITRYIHAVGESTRKTPSRFAVFQDCARTPVSRFSRNLARGRSRVGGPPFVRDERRSKTKRSSSRKLRRSRWIRAVTSRVRVSRAFEAPSRGESPRANRGDDLFVRHSVERVVRARVRLEREV